MVSGGRGCPTERAVTPGRVVSAVTESMWGHPCQSLLTVTGNGWNHGFWPACFAQVWQPQAPVKDSEQTGRFRDTEHNDTDTYDTESHKPDGYCKTVYKTRTASSLLQFSFAVV